MSQWNTARSFTAAERSADRPQREASTRSSASMRPSRSKPTSYWYRKSWRLPVPMMSSSRSARSFTGRPVARARSAAPHGVYGGLRFLAAEAAAQAAQLHGDGGVGHAERRRDEVLDLARVLGRGMHEHFAALAGKGEERSGPRGRSAPAPPQRSRPFSRYTAPGSVARLPRSHRTEGRTNCCFSSACFDRDHGLEPLVFDARKARRAPRKLHARSGHREDAAGRGIPRARTRAPARRAVPGRCCWRPECRPR